MMQKQRWREFKRVLGILRRGGGSPIITSGLGLSWVIFPLGPWSLGRGRGVRLATGHALRQRCGGGYFY